MSNGQRHKGAARLRSNTTHVHKSTCLADMPRRLTAHPTRAGKTKTYATCLHPCGSRCTHTKLDALRTHLGALPDVDDAPRQPQDQNPPAGAGSHAVLHAFRPSCAACLPDNHPSMHAAEPSQNMVDSNPPVVEFRARLVENYTSRAPKLHAPLNIRNVCVSEVLPAETQATQQRQQIRNLAERCRANKEQRKRKREEDSGP